MEKTKIAVLVSGGGTNLQALIDAEKSGVLTSGEIVLVVSNNPSAYALERAAKNGIRTVTVDRKACASKAEFEKRILEALDAAGIELIILAGFMAILSADFVRRYPNRILNVHPALIPSFCGEGYYGLRVHEAALSRGVKVTGATVHFVNEIADGGPILLQKAVEIREGDTPEILQKRVMEQAEWILLPRAAETVSAEIRNRKEQEQMKDLAELLANNPYPGRGIVVGRDCVYYWIMGRSANSRNRVFTLTDDGIKTEAFDPAALEDPSLIIYHPVRKMGDALVVTNGDQTDTIVEAGDFRKALMTREYEPDEPNWTPRISAILYADGSRELSILKRKGDGCLRCFYNYESIPEGVGYFISTYQGDGKPLPSFEGEPVEVRLASPEDVWKALNGDNKVSLYTNVNGEVRLFNKNLGD